MNFETILIVFLVIIVSMMLHELAHGLVAYWLGDDTAKMEGRLTLNPLKHLDPVLSLAVPLLLAISGGPIFGGAKPVPINTSRLKHGAWGMALVAIAGPLTNFILAFVAFAIGAAGGAIFVENGVLMYVGDFWGELLANMIYINLGFGIFNLIPIPPLDGSRVLYAIAPDPVRNIMEQMERWGMVIVLLLVVVFSGVLSVFLTGAMQGILDGFAGLVGIFGG